MNWYKNIFRDKQQEQRMLDLIIATSLEVDALKIDNKNLFRFLEEEEQSSFILKWLLFLSISGNIGQLIYYLI